MLTLVITINTYSEMWTVLKTADLLRNYLFGYYWLDILRDYFFLSHPTVV